MRQRTADRRPWGRWALLVGITALAAFFRLHRIDRLPPADGYDAAYYGVDALQLLEGQPPRLMYPPNREPLFSYLVAGSFLLFGASTTAIHLTSALVGILTVPLIYLLADALFKGAEKPLDAWGAPLAALVMALSYWHLNWSRLGVRAILVPLCAAATVAFLWRGRPVSAGSASGRPRNRLGRESVANLMLCGIFLGLSMYTYQAARLLPVLVAMGLVASAWDRARKRTKRSTVVKRHCQGLAVVAVVSLVVFAPLGAHFVTHPGSFSRRIEEALVVETEEAAVNNLQAIVDQVQDTLLAFSFVGDATPYSTIPGRPSLNPFLSALLVLGIGVSLLEIASRRSRSKPGRLLLLIWLILMTVPAALAGKGPTAKRAIGALPAVAVLAALGALKPCSYLRRRLWPRSPGRTRWVQAAWIIVLLGGLVYSGVATYRDYFTVWASNPDLPTHFEAHISAIGEYIGDLPPEQQVYLSPELPRHPAIRFHANLREGIRGYNGRVCFAAPSTTTVETTYIIVPSKEDTSLALLETYFPAGTRVNHRPEDGHTTFASYHIPAGVQAGVEPSRPLRASWDDAIQLVGYHLHEEIYQPGEMISLTLTYRDLERMEEHYTVFVHLLGPVNPATGNPLWGQNDSEPCHGFYPTTSWHEGEILIDRIKLRIDDDAPPGTYRLGTGFYDVWTGERLPVGPADAPSESRTLILGEVHIRANE